MKFFFILLFSMVTFSSLRLNATPSPSPLNSPGANLYAEAEYEAENTPDFQQKFIRMLFSLGLLLSLLILVLWIVKKMTQNSFPLSMKTKIKGKIIIIESQRISYRSSAYFAEVNGKGVLIVESPHGIGLMEVPLTQDRLKNSEVS